MWIGREKLGPEQLHCFDFSHPSGEEKEGSAFATRMWMAGNISVPHFGPASPVLLLNFVCVCR